MRALNRYSKQRRVGSISKREAQFPSRPCDISFTADSGWNWPEIFSALRSDGSGSTWTRRFIIRLHFHEYASIIRNKSFRKDCKTIPEIILTPCLHILLFATVQSSFKKHRIFLQLGFFPRIYCLFIFILSLLLPL